MIDETIGRNLLEAICSFALQNPDPAIGRFKDSVSNWGNEYRAIEPVRLPAINCLDDAAANAESPARELLELFARHKEHLYWEQSYKKEDGYVPDAMLANYGFAEILGSRGPFVSHRIRSGIGIYGPGVHYPRHWHEAEEIYLPLSGSAQFTIDGQSAERGPGEVVFVASNTPHGFVVGEERAMVLFYLWQAGDLRQTSNFG